MDILNLVLIAILIALTAFFVVSEFAIVKVRATRLDQLTEEGNRSARSAKRVIERLDDYLSACQLGITMTTLALGWLAIPPIGEALAPLFTTLEVTDTLASLISFTIGFLAITFLHVLFGKIGPKTLALQKAERMTLLTARPLIWFFRLMYPFLSVLNGTARGMTQMLGLKPASINDLAHSEEELRQILSESFKSGEINQSEFKYVNKIFEFDNRIAKEIMVPRREIVTLSKDATLEEFLTVVNEEKFTRYPIIDGDKDHIIGMVNIKEIVTELIQNRNLHAKTLELYTRPIIRVIDTVPIHDLLVKMQKDRIHMAVLMDEYGGTSGLVTVEDIIEEIVGEIRDEFDMDEIPSIRKINEDHYILDSKILVSEVNELLGLDIDDEDVDTLGGWILTENYEAREGDEILYDHYTFKIIDMEEHHMKYVEVTKLETAPTLLDTPINVVSNTDEVLSKQSVSF